MSTLSVGLYILIGAGLGAALGYFGKCSSGSCPLTANWRRGAVFGGFLGGILFFTTGGSTPATMNVSTANVQRINENQFDAEVAASKMPVVVDFYATWCPPCKILSPELDRLAGAFTNQIKFVKINVDEAPTLSQRFNIQAIPSLLFFRNGVLENQITGVPGTAELEAALKAFASTSTKTVTTPR